MEVVTPPSPNGSPSNFDFNSARISPYLSAPSSPKRFGEYHYLSAPTSPSRFFSEFDSSYDWEPKIEGGEGFAFSVNGESENPSRSAEELFDGGKIKPLLSESAKSPLLSGPQPKKSSAIAQGKKAIREAFGAKKKKEEDLISEERRGRDRSVGSSNSGRRVTRSLSPYRISDYTWEEEQNQTQSNKEDSKGSRKWSLRDFLLFRSASEGRGSSKDPLRKFPSLYRKPAEFKSSIPGPGPGPRPRRKEPLSAHELHYARKKAESQDLKKRTFLPYKQGILGRLAGFGST